jgi:uncharacterized phage protein (TIGR02218 family)
MTYSAISALLYGQRPFFLYQFVRDGNETLYTSQPVDFTRSVAGVDGDLWAASSIAHSRIPDTDRSFRSEVRITLPLQDQFAFAILGSFDFKPVAVAIWRGFLNDTDEELVPVFRGQVLGVEPKDQGVIELSCMTDIASLERKGLAAVMQRPCRHSLYSRGCRLDITDWQAELPIASMDAAATSLVVTGADAQANGYYDYGVAEWDGRFAVILTHTGNNLRLGSFIPGLRQAFLAGPVDIKIAPGCNLALATCAAKFGNQLNFGGFPRITDNPFDGKAVF